MLENQSIQSDKVKEILNRFKNNNEPIQLIKTEFYFCSISVFKINDRYIEVTQDSEGRYHLYELSEKELEKYHQILQKLENRVNYCAVKISQNRECYYE